MTPFCSLSLHQLDENTAGGGRMEKGDWGSSRSPPGCGFDEHAARGSRRRHRPANVGYAKRDVVQSWTMGGQELGKRTTLAQWLEQLEVHAAGAQERDAHTLIGQLVLIRHAQAKNCPVESSRVAQVAHSNPDVVERHPLSTQSSPSSRSIHRQVPWLSV